MIYAKHDIDSALPLPFCNSINAADLHSEKLPLGSRADGYLLLSDVEPGERVPGFVECEYPLGIQGSNNFSL